MLQCLVLPSLSSSRLQQPNNSTTYISARQLYQFVLQQQQRPHSSAFYKVFLRKLPRPGLKAKAAQVQHLQQRAAINPAARNVFLVSLAQAQQMCQGLGMPAAVTTQFSSPLTASQPVAAAPVPPLPGQASPAAAAAAAAAAVAEAVAAAGAGPSGSGQAAATAAAPAPAADWLQGAMPHQLPEPTFTQEQLQQFRFGLQTLPSVEAEAECKEVAVQLELYKPWRTATIMLSRPKWVSLLQPSCWPGHANEALRYMGFLYSVMSQQHPRLQHVLDGYLVMQYISFLRARGVGPAKLGAAVLMVRCVAEWVWSTQLPAAQVQLPSQQQLYQQYQARLEILCHQCRNNLLPDPVKVERRLQQQQQLAGSMTAEQLVALMQALWNEAAVMVPLLREGCCESRADTAEFIMQVAMVCMFFGFLPPMRVSVVVSLLMPNTAACNHVNCQLPARCKGNRVQYVAGGEQLQLYCPHHKTERHGVRPIDLVLPPELFLLLHAHIKVGRKLIMSRLQQQGKGRHVAATAQAGYLFMWPSTGKPVAEQQCCQLFQQLVLDSPACAAQFGPQWCRALFVGERRGASRLEVGMSDAAAAAVMNNSVGVWKSSYDKFKASRQAAEVQQGMQLWRAGMLGKAQAGDLLHAAGQQLLQQQLGSAAAAGVAAAGAEVIVISDSDADEDCESSAMTGSSCSMDGDSVSMPGSSCSMSEGDESEGDESAGSGGDDDGTDGVGCTEE